MSIDHLLNRTCSISSTARGAADGYGGFAEAAPVAVAANCRLSPLSARERDQLGRRDIEATFALYLNAATSIERGDTVTLTDGQEPSAVFEVEEVHEPSVLGHHKRAALSGPQGDTE